MNFPVWIRHVIVPGLTLNIDDLKKLRKFLDTLSNIKKIEVLPYHNLAISKYQELNIKYKLIDTRLPNNEEIELARTILKAN